MGFYWLDMGKDADLVHTQCKAYHLAIDTEESYVIFANEDWRSPFMQYLTECVLPQKHSERFKLKKLAIHYFLHEEILFKKGYDEDPLRCLGPQEAGKMIREVHVGECGKDQGKKKLYRWMLQMGYYWPTIKRDMAEFVKNTTTTKCKPT